MSIQLETIIFLKFVGLGILFAILFDFFRAFRKVKKPSKNIVTLQDIIYFVIIGIILVSIVINVNDEVFRLYLMLAIVLGAIIYSLIMGNKVRDGFVILLNGTGGVLDFVFLPVKIQIMFFQMIGKKTKKYVNLCCKKKSDMIEFYHKKMKNGKHKEKGSKVQKKEES